MIALWVRIVLFILIRRIKQKNITPLAQLLKSLEKCTSWFSCPWLFHQRLHQICLHVNPTKRIRHLLFISNNLCAVYPNWMDFTWPLANQQLTAQLQLDVWAECSSLNDLLFVVLLSTCQIYWILWEDYLTLTVPCQPCNHLSGPPYLQFIQNSYMIATVKSVICHIAQPPKIDRLPSLFSVTSSQLLEPLNVWIECHYVSP